MENHNNKCSNDYIKNRIAEALEIRNMKQVELAEKTGLSSPQINSWKNQRWQPKQTALHLMAKALDVSEMWLAGYDTPMERPIEQKKADQLALLVKLFKENPQLNNIFSMISKLDQEQIDTIEKLLISITSANNK